MGTAAFFVPKGHLVHRDGGMDSYEERDPMAALSLAHTPRTKRRIFGGIKRTKLDFGLPLLCLGYLASSLSCSLSFRCLVGEWLLSATHFIKFGNVHPFP